MTVQVRTAVAGSDPRGWLEAVSARLPPNEPEVVASALGLARELYGERSTAEGESLLTHWMETAGILAELRMDAATLAGALVGGVPTLAADGAEVLSKRLGADIASLAEGVARMGQIQALRGRLEPTARSSDRAAQLESLRKMLLAMVQDVRVVIVKLAEQTQNLRYLAARGEPAARKSAARDTFDLFAPLANRLGVWQLKWELEDLAFRCSEPDVYKSIARELDERRPDREAFIHTVIERLRSALEEARVAAEVTGRPKHIYSIYRKLSRKGLTLKELTDVRGVRVLVSDVKDCYAALGLVHNLWTPLPREFDDYIAKPKPNHYRSLHTAVVGSDGKVLEVQIRTWQMHQECEYGVAAHWRYKESAPVARANRRGAAFDERIAWLRQILDWRDGLADLVDLADHFRTGLAEDTVYALTPQGRVIDLPVGSTPVDFAYHVHSDLGHRCRGAKVDGEMVPLNFALSNGQTVEIIAAKSGGPSRDWLNPELKFIASHRARAKVRQWFNYQNLEASIAQGRQIVEKLLQRAGLTALGLDKLAAQLEFEKVDELLAAVGRNEIGPRQLQAAFESVAQPPAKEAANPAPVEVPEPAVRSAPRSSSDVLVVGVDRLLTVLARCCKPAPPDPIIGFVSRGRGVSVHRESCPNVARLNRERLIAAEWGSDRHNHHFPVDVEIDGTSEPRLMRDILDVFAREKVAVAAARSQARDPLARMFFTLEVADLGQLARLLGQVRDMPGVSSARRR
jgi:GTP pyrophosphokinase